MRSRTIIDSFIPTTASTASMSKMKIAPPLKHTLEEALEYIQADEYVEVTPKSIRLRKIYLTEGERKRFGKN